MRVLWLADVLRSAGLTVHTYSGWETRGSSSWGPLRGVICHATAGSRTSTDAGEMRVLWETGSSSAPAPISQMYLSRSGVWTVGATGRCNHVLTGQIGPHKGYGNSALLGVEAQNDNRGEPWSAHMLDSYQRGVAAICRHMGWPASVAVAHREHQTDKSDPAGIDMTAFRRRVAELLAGGQSTEEDDMATIVQNTDGSYWVLGADGVARKLKLPSGINDVGWIVSGRFFNPSGVAQATLLPYNNPATGAEPWISIPRLPLSVLAVESDVTAEVDEAAIAAEVAKLSPKPLTAQQTEDAAFRGAQKAETQ